MESVSFFKKGFVLEKSDIKLDKEGNSDAFTKFIRKIREVM